MLITILQSVVVARGVATGGVPILWPVVDIHMWVEASRLGRSE